jgi:catechol 2,3-dioxygenase-like lactoylglutathione lyase family enzyme
VRLEQRSRRIRPRIGGRTEARIHVFTLAVSDLERALSFYRDGLGLDSVGVIGTEFVGDDDNAAGAVVMFNLKGGLTLALYPRSELAKDAQVPLGPSQTGEFSIGHLVASKDDVDTLLAQAKAAGATVTGPAHERPWGIYSGYFSDLDGHLWEIIWNPQLDSGGP